MTEEQTEAKYIPKGVRLFQKAIKYRDAALKKEDRERKQRRDKLRAQMRREVKTQLLANIEEIDSELLARIVEFEEDGGIYWRCGTGERGEALVTLLHDHYRKEGLSVRVERYEIWITTSSVAPPPEHYLRLKIPEVAEYQRRGRSAWEQTLIRKG